MRSAVIFSGLLCAAAITFGLLAWRADQTAPSRWLISPPAPRPTAPKAPAPPATVSEYFGRVVTTGPTAGKLVALTFDGGAGDWGVNAILSTLEATHTPATFFLTGQFTEKYSADAVALAAYGPIGNHSYSHPHFPTLTAEEQQNQVQKTDALIKTFQPSNPPLFRFPYGDQRAGDLATVNALGFAAIGWTFDTLGWLGTTAGQSVASIIERVRSKVKPGAIVLMHLGANPRDKSRLDADALPQVIETLAGLGFSFVTVPALLKLSEPR